MNAAEEIDSLHKELLESINGLSEEQLTRPDTFGRWSAREVLLHIAMWIGECLKAICVWKTGHDYDWQYASDYLKYNDFWVKSCEELTVKQIIQMLNLNLFALANELRSIPPDVWSTRGIPDWLQEIAIGHTRGHLQKITLLRHRESSPDQP